MASEKSKTNYHISSLLRKLQSSSFSSVQKALISLSRATRKPENVVKLREEGGIDLLLAFLKSSNKKDLDMAVSVLANCALEKQSRTEINRLNGLTLLCNLLASLADTSILSRVTRALANLSQDVAIAGAIMSLDTIPKLLGILKESSDVALLQNTLRTFRIMSRSYACTSALAEDNRVLCFVEVLQKEHGIEIKRCCLRTLLELTKAANGVLATHIQKHGAIQAVCQLSYSDDEDIKENCINILCTLTKYSTVRVSVGTMGGIEAFIHQIRDRGPSLFLSIEGISRCCREAVNRNKVRSCGGLETLLDILRCPQYSKAFDHILGGFCCFSYDEVALKYMIANGLIPILVSILHKQLFPEHKEIAKKEDKDASTTSKETKAISSSFKNSTSKLSKRICKPTATAITVRSGASNDSPSSRTLPLLSEMSDPASPPSCISPNLSPELRVPHLSSCSPQSERSSSPMVYSPSGSEIDDDFSSESDSDPEQETEGGSSAPSQDNAASQPGGSTARVGSTISNRSSSKEESEQGSSRNDNSTGSNENVLSTLMEDLATTHSGDIAILRTLDAAYRQHGRLSKDEEKLLLRWAYGQRSKVHLPPGASFNEYVHLFLPNENLFSADQPSPRKVPASGSNRYPWLQQSRSSEFPATSKKPNPPPRATYTNGLEEIEGKIIFLLSRFGQMPDAEDLESLLSPPCIQILLDYLCYFKNPDSRCERLFSRLVWDLKCFERLVVNMFPGALYRQLICGLRPGYLLSDHASAGTESVNKSDQTPEASQLTSTITVVNEPAEVMPSRSGPSSTSTEENVASNPNLDSCSSVALPQLTSPSTSDIPRNITKHTGKSLISVLTTQASSSFGEGILTHLLLRGTERQKLACALSLPYLCSQVRMKRKLLIDCKGILMILSILSDSNDQTDIIRAVHSITYLIANSALKMDKDFSVFVAIDEREFLFPHKSKEIDTLLTKKKKFGKYFSASENDECDFWGVSSKPREGTQTFDASSPDEERLLSRETARLQRGEECGCLISERYRRLHSMMDRGMCSYQTAPKRLRDATDGIMCKRTKVELGDTSAGGNCCYDKSHSTSFDVVIKLDTGESIEAHRSVLCAFSDVFAAMLSTDFVEASQSEVVIKELNHATAVFLLHYAYGCRWSVHERFIACPLLEESLSAGNSPPSNDSPSRSNNSPTSNDSPSRSNNSPPSNDSPSRSNNSPTSNDSPSSDKPPSSDRFKFDFEFLMDLLACADRFLLTALKKQCENLMMYGLTGERVVDAYLTAVLYNTARLRVYCLQFIFLGNLELECVYKYVVKLLQCEERETVIEDFKKIALDSCTERG